MDDQPQPLPSGSEVLAMELASRPRGAQADLARELGVQPQTVNKWVQGVVRLPVVRWLDVERALGLPPLTIARRTGLLDRVPSFAEVPLSDLDESWRRNWTFGRERDEADRRERAVVAKYVGRLFDQLRPIAKERSFVGEQIVHGVRFGALFGLYQDLLLYLAMPPEEPRDLIKRLARAANIEIGDETLTKERIVPLIRQIEVAISQIEDAVTFLSIRKSVSAKQFAVAAEGADGAPPADTGKRVARPQPEVEDD